MSMGTTFRQFVGIRARHAALAVTVSLVASAALALPMQSPIDITSANTVYSVLPPLQFDYGNSVVLDVENTGSPEKKRRSEPPSAPAPIRCRCQVSPTTCCSSISTARPSMQSTVFVRKWRCTSYPGHRWQRQTAGGGPVHRSRRRERRAGPIFSALPPTEASPHLTLAGFDLGALLPSDLSSFRYTGSLTTSPYTEGVSWNLLSSPTTMSHEQIDAFRTLFYEPEGNTRPLQSLNGRVVLTDVEGFAVPEPGTWMLVFMGLAAIRGVAAQTPPGSLTARRDAFGFIGRAGQSRP